MKKRAIISAADILREGANTFEERNAIYSNNFRIVGDAMQAFFPEGIELITAQDHARFHIFMLVVVKLTRYTNNWGVGGHADSVRDAAVYCAMLESIDAMGPGPHSRASRVESVRRRPRKPLGRR